MYKKILLFILFTLIPLEASQYAIVVNKESSITNLTRKQVKDLFLMKRHFVDDIKIIPVNVTSTHDLRKVFEINILKIKEERLNKYWIKKHFQGISPPITQSSDNSMKLFIKNVNGAIGYIPLSKLDKDLKVLYEF